MSINRNDFYEVEKHWDTHGPKIFSELSLAMGIEDFEDDYSFEYSDHLTPAEALCIVAGLMNSFGASGNITMAGKQLEISK